MLSSRWCGALLGICWAQWFGLIARGQQPHCCQNGAASSRSAFCLTVLWNILWFSQQIKMTAYSVVNCMKTAQITSTVYCFCGFFYSAWMDVLLWLLCEFVFEANILKLMWALWVPRSPFGAVTVLSPFGAVTVLSPFGVVSVVTLVKTNSELLSVCVCK